MLQIHYRKAAEQTRRVDRFFPTPKIMNISLWDIRKLFVKTLGAVAIVISALNPIVRKRLMLTKKKGFLLCKVCFFAYITSITHHNAVKDSFDVASFLDQAQ